MNLTDEPKLFYFKEVREKDKTKIKYINLHPVTTKLERLDTTKFKICDYSKIKKGTFYVFRCHDAAECEDWIYKISKELDKLK